MEFDYGKVCPDFWKKMLDFCKEGRAFSREQTLVETTCEALVDRLILKLIFDDNVVGVSVLCVWTTSCTVTPCNCVVFLGGIGCAFTITISAYVRDTT